MKIALEEVIKAIGYKVFEFPKYSTQFINVANQNAKGTNPASVGQMSELIHQSKARTVAEWEGWYLENHPGKIEAATEKVWDKLQQMKSGMNAITKDMVHDWIYDLVINKTAEGLIIQEFILKKLAESEGVKYRLASPDEEARNIDGYIGDEPVQIKPASYKLQKSTVHEKIDVRVIYYSKTEKYLVFE